MPKKKDSRLKRAGVSGFNKPKRTPGHKTKSHVVVAKVGSMIKTIRFGQQGVRTAGKPKDGESQKQKNRRKSFKARHGKNIAKGKTSAAYWADKVKWQSMKGVKHYTKQGKTWESEMHKMPNGQLHSGKTHSKSSQKLFHFGGLSKKSKIVAKKSWGK